MKQTQIPEFKIRASGCGKIMGKKGLGKTGETYLKTWLKGQILNRKPEITSKFLEKGNIMEDNSLDIVADTLGLGMLLKNEKHFANDYMTGTPDAILPDLIIDVKNSWSWETFPLLDKEVPNEEYHWQMQVYMALCDKPAAKLIYTLLDTPEYLIEREARWYSINNGYGELSDEMFNEFKAKMTYSDIPKEKKIKIFDVPFVPDDIELIKERVTLCREFLNILTLPNTVKK